MSDWFVVNVRDAQWYRNEAFGSSALHIPEDQAPRLGVHLVSLEPGKPNCMYHEENNQEAFLVLDGECVLIVDGEERRLQAWDFFHCPAGTRHVFVGAGDGPCAILMVGARRPDEELLYPADETAAGHGASVPEDTPDPEVAYAPFPDYEPAPAPPGPWAR